ncbi:Acg family FMN-binding oxidoreductase [Cytobacillus purgationiresistens]|uniref:Nitroreductase domain-containing protein n=1 Tax=Cytobacillus purgationiresistens TaxID=863449 RepID=A0ABU0ARU8_9BACI|nr:hypothetical protein [Cytobacillus purgationiresistens]MDQ0273908.1 hypothetical protein [Cytobacillus purgationiresistens]
MNKKAENNHSTSTRREFLKKAGTSFLVVSFGGLLWRAIDQGVFSTGKGPAYELWSPEESSHLTDSLALVHDAVLASNPHNSQPWIFKASETSIELFADKTRNLGSMDPLLREMHMGLGCAVENMVLSAQEKGYFPKVEYFPDPLDLDYIAKVELNPGTKKSSILHQAIPHRHTHRGPYDKERTVSTEILGKLKELCEDEPNVQLTWLSTSEEKQKTSKLVIAATESIIVDEEMSHDSNIWYRGNWEELQKYRDGLTLDAQGGPAWVRAAGKMLPNVSHESANQFWLKSTRQTHVPTAAAFGLLTIKELTDHESQLRAGRIWQRIHLQGANDGLGLHPLNQPMEMRDREIQLGSKTHNFKKKLTELSRHSTGEAIFLFRIGYPLSPSYPSPRRELKDVII